MLSESVECGLAEEETPSESVECGWLRDRLSVVG